MVEAKETKLPVLGRVVQMRKMNGERMTMEFHLTT